MNALVTGGAGFIGSHLVDALINEGYNVTVIDNLSSSTTEFVNKKAKFIHFDLKQDIPKEFLEDIETVFHFAADPNVKTSSKKTEEVFKNNVLATFNILEACRKSNVKKFVFASTSAVYGIAKKFPTPEEHQLNPISNYGASKVCGEVFCSSYSHSYGIRTIVLRLANIIGERSLHGVIYDFFQKMRANKEELLILGNGKQKKSYLYISDCIEAILLASKIDSTFEVFNIGSEEQIEVNKIANIVINALNLNPRIRYS
ncbi:MAG: NAD-dependent epimerase/dehydratase family protein, partial [Candidatus Aenigmatarchaeota archaeon]